MKCILRKPLIFHRHFTLSFHEIRRDDVTHKLINKWLVIDYNRVLNARENCILLFPFLKRRYMYLNMMHHWGRWEVKERSHPIGACYCKP
jgi:hypothetical protein